MNSKILNALHKINSIWDINDKDGEYMNPGSLVSKTWFRGAPLRK